MRSNPAVGPAPSGKLGLSALCPLPDPPGTRLSSPVRSGVGLIQSLPAEHDGTSAFLCSRYRSSGALTPCRAVSAHRALPAGPWHRMVWPSNTRLFIQVMFCPVFNKSSKIANAKAFIPFSFFSVGKK